MDSFFSIGKRLTFSVVVILALGYSQYTLANITASGINTTMCPIPPSISVDPIVIAETQVNDFAVTNNAGDYRSMLLTFDGANFTIDVTGSSVSYNAPDFAVVPVVTVNGAGTLIFRLIVNTTTALDAFTVSGITVTPLKPSVTSSLVRAPLSYGTFNSLTAAGSTLLTYSTFTSYPKANINESTATICSGLPLNLTLTSTLPGTQYTWTASSLFPSISGFANNPSLATQITDVLTNSGSVSGTVVYTVSSTASVTGCAGDVKNVVVTVKPYNNFSGTSSGSTCDFGVPSIKLFSTIPGTLFNYTMSYSGSVSTNTANPYTQTSVSSITGITFYNSTGSPQFVNFDITPIGPGCAVASSSFTLTVNPTPSFAGGTGSVCSGNTFNYNLVSTPVGATFTWVASANNGTPTGFSSSTIPGVTAISQVLIAGPAYSQVLYYATPTLKGCSGFPVGVYVDVNPGTSITTPATATICSGFSTNIPLTLSSGTPTGWGWTVSSSGGVSGYSAGTGSSINQSLTGAGLVSYIVTASGVSGGCGTPIKQIDVTVLGKPTLTSPTTFAICNGQNTNISLTSSPTGASFDWTSSLTSGVVSGQSNGSGNSISQVLTNSNLTNGSVRYLVTLTANGCVGIPANIDVTVKPTPTVTTLATASICGGTNVNTLLSLSNNLGAGTYRWSSNVTSGVANSPGNATSPNSGPLSDVVTVGNGSTATILYGITATVNGCGSALSTTTITAYGAPSVTTSSPPTFCFGNTVSIPGTGIAGLGISNYSWSRDSHDGNGFVDIDNSNKNNLDGNVVSYSGFNTPALVIATNNTNQAVSLDTYNYKIQVVGFCGTTTSTAVLNQGGSTQVDIYTFKSLYCTGDQKDIIKAYPSSGIGTWIVSPSTIPGITKAGNTLTINPAFVPLNQPFTTTYTIGGGTCKTILTNTASVGAKPTVTISRTPSSASVFNTDPTVTYTGTPVFGGTGVYSGTGVSGNKFYPSIVTPGKYGVTYTFTDATSGCYASAVDTILVVDASAQINFNGSPSNSNFCIYDNTDYPIFYNGPTLTKFYGVYTNPYFMIDPGIQGPGVAQSLTYTSPYTIVGGYFKFNPSTSGIAGTKTLSVMYSYLIPTVPTGSPTGTETRYTFSYTSFNVNVLNRPALPVISSTRTQYCPGDPVQSFTSTGSNLSWFYPSTITSDLKASGVNTISAAVLFGTNTPPPGVYKIYVTQGISDANCRSLPSVFTITVNGFPAAPTVSLVDPSVKCSGVSNNYTLSSSGIANTLSWYSDPGLTNLVASSASTYVPTIFNSGIYSNSTTVSFYATQTLNNCQSPSGQVTVDVIPTPPSPSILTLSNYCTSDIIKPITVTSNNLSSTFSWYKSSNLVGTNLISSGLTQTVGGTALYNSYLPIGVPTNKSVRLDTSFYATQTVNGCESPAAQVGFSVFVRPQKLIISADSQDCITNADFPINLVNALPNASFKWYNGSLAFTNQFSVSGILASQINLNKNLAGTTVKYVTQTENGCESAYARYTLTVFGSTPLPTKIVPKPYCQFDVIQTLSVTGSNIKWYDNGGSLLAGGTPFYTPSINTALSGNTIYRVSQTINGCESDKNDPNAVITVIVNPKPSVPTFPGGIVQFSGCDGQRPFAIITAAGVGGKFNWYADAALSSLLVQNNAVASSSQLSINSSPGLSFPTNTTSSIYVTDSLLNCRSDYTKLDFTVLPIPPKPLLNPPTQSKILVTDNVTQNSKTFCVGQAIADRSISTNNFGSSFKWYASPTDVGVNPITAGSSYSFTPTISTATGGTYYYYVTQMVQSCESPYAVDTIIVYDRPGKPVIGTIPVYCQSQPLSPIVATGTSSGIVRWYNDPQLPKPAKDLGVGAKGYVDPSLNVNIAQTVYYYATQTVNNCEGDSTIAKLTIYPTPVVNFPLIQSRYCVDDPAVSLSGTAFINSIDVTSLTGIYIVNGNTITAGGFYSGNNGGVSSNFFIPSVAGVNLHQIRYTYVSPFGCSNSSSQNTEVKPLPDATFTTLNSYYCKDPSVKIFASASSSNVLSQAYLRDGQPKSSPFDVFDLDANAIHNIRYDVTDIYGCKNSSVQTFRVDPLPVADFTTTNLCAGDIITFTDASLVPNTLVSDFVVSRKWNILGTFFTTSGVSYPTQVSDAGTKNASLDVESSLGCKASIAKSLTIGVYPIPSFIIRNTCQGDTVVFFNKSTVGLGNTITGFSWAFGDGVSVTGGNMNISGGGTVLGSYPNPQKIYAMPGKYQVTMGISTDKNCAARDTQNVYILPKIKPNPTGPYVQNFANGDGGFATNNKSGYGRNNSWQFGVPSKPYTNWTGNAWYTGKDSSYNSNENSWVDCPCFDLSEMKKPMISLEIKSLLDKVDGAVILYAVGKDTTWTQLGKSRTYGLNWYDDDNLNSSSPGDQAGLPSKGITYPGWTGVVDTVGWRTSRFSLDALAGNPSVKFRIAFGSTGSVKVKKYEGFAFKNFTVKDRAKVVLLEHFTNASAPVSGVANIIPSVDNSTVIEVNKFNKNNTAVGVIPVFYHTSFPGKDTLNALNTADPSSKYGQYGISSVPRTILDGNFFNGASFGQASGWTEDILTQRTLTDPVFAFNFDVVTNTGFVSATANITALTALDSGYYSIQMAVIENINTVPGIVGGNGQKDFYYALRKFLPSGSGTTLNRTWVKGATYSSSQNWTYSSGDRPFNPAKVGVVGFIQNSKTKEVYQVGYKIPGVAANITDLDKDTDLYSSSNTLNIYPNPASDEVLLQFEHAVLNDRNWVIYDALGVTVLSGTIDAGYSQSFIGTSSLASGWYILVLQPENGKPGITQKLVIQH